MPITIESQHESAQCHLYCIESLWYKFVRKRVVQLNFIAKTNYYNKYFEAGHQLYYKWVVMKEVQINPEIYGICVDSPGGEGEG